MCTEWSHKAQTIETSTEWSHKAQTIETIEIESIFLQNL